MPRIQLRVYVQPGAAEVFFGVLRKDGIYERLTAVIDTGGEVSLMPYDLLEFIDFQPSAQGHVMIEQAGIAKQAFEAIEGYVRIILEDQTGTQSQPFDMRVWFANTNRILFCFADFLDRAVLHLDMPQRTGWLEFEP
jgi:hypothetical protein